MICPKCGKETLTILDYCQNCKADLTEFHKLRDSTLEGTGETHSGFSLESKLLNFGPAGGIILMLIAVVWFITSYSAGRMLVHPLILFITGLVVFFKA